MKPLQGLIACLFLLLSLAATGRAAGLTVTTYTAPDSGFAVNSHLIAGDRDAVLVDAQFLLGEAAGLAAFVRRSGRNLTHIIVTHGHPDHFFGLQVLREAFPDARIVATREVIAGIEAYAPQAIAAWKPVFKDQVPDDFVRPASIDAGPLFLEGEEIRLIEIGQADSAHATVLWLPGTRALLAGDLVYSDVHLWLAENRPEAWLAVLERLEALSPETIYPGHGPAGGIELIARNREYLRAFIDATAARSTREQASAALKGGYPGYALPVIVDYSVAGRLPH